MATHCTIIALCTDGKVRSIYCNGDGHIYGVGLMLQQHYTDQDKIEAMLALGDLSILRESIECPAGHSFNTPVRDYTIAYCRDRGESWNDMSTQVFPDLKEALEDPTGHVFVWNGEEWYYNSIAFLNKKLEVR